jgi:putative hydrolase of the HAD superfamily
MIKTIIFDADHTLYVPRSERAYDEKFSYIANSLGISQKRLRKIWEEQVERAIEAGGPSNRAREKVLERTLMELELPPDDREELVEEAMERFWSQVVDDLEHENGVDEMLNRLKSRNVEMMAVASDEFREPLERKLQKVIGDWEDYFETLVTPRTTGSMKPSKQFFEEVLEQLDIEAGETLVVGDSWERDLEPAKELGMKTVLLADEEEGDPDVHITSILNLEQVVKQL